MAATCGIDAENNTITWRNAATFLFPNPMMRMPSSFLSHLQILPSQVFPACSTFSTLSPPNFFTGIVRKIRHVRLQNKRCEHRLVWYEVEGDNLWVLLEYGKATGMEIWESPVCLGRFLDKDKPFYIRFSPNDESLYYDVSNSSTLEKAKRIAQKYYATMQSKLSITMEKNGSHRIPSRSE